MATEIPEGFVVENSTPDLPPGFVLESPPISARSDSQIIQQGNMKPEDLTTGERALGAVDAALSLGSEVLASIPNLTIGGLLAIGDAILRQTSGYGHPTERAAELVEKGSIVPTYSPKTEAGQQTLEAAQWALNLPFEQVEKLARNVQDMRIEQGGTGAIEATAVHMLPDIIGGLLGVRGSNFRKVGDMKRLRGEAEKLGLDLKAPLEEQQTQIKTQGEKFSGSGMEGIENVPPAIKESRQAESARISEIFKEGKEGGATIASRSTGKLVDNAKNALKDFTYEDLPTVNNTLNKLEELGLPAKTSLTEQMGKRNTAQTAINDIMELRKGINKDLPSDVSSREYRALSEIKSQLDSYLQDAFDKDMINGSPEALKRWKEGFSDWKDFKELYDDNRTIRMIWRDKLSPEQVKRLIFNKNAVNPSAGSGTLVRDLKTILGEDSAQFQTLRMTALEDIMKPVVGRNPNYRQFAQNWDKFKADNPTLVKELLPDELVKEVDSFSEFVDTIDKINPESQRNLSIPRIASVFAVGHGLARRAAGVAFGQRIATALLDPGRETKILSGVLGYNVRQPLISNAVIENIGAAEAARKDKEYVFDGNKLVPKTQAR